MANFNRADERALHLSERASVIDPGAESLPVTGDADEANVRIYWGNGDWTEYRTTAAGLASKTVHLRGFGSNIDDLSGASTDAERWERAVSELTPR